MSSVSTWVSDVSVAASTSGETPALHVDYFDGLSARAHPAQLSVVGRGAERQLRITWDDGFRDVAWRDVQWPERQRHGPRIAHLAEGGELHSQDHAAWDAFARHAGVGESWVVRAQQNWRSTLAALGVLTGLLVLGYLWGLPWAAKGLVAATPTSVDQKLGELALAGISDRWLQPSALPPADQERLRSKFKQIVQRGFPDGNAPAYELRFHKSSIGPNAFALPGGTVVLTDELVTLVDNRDEVVLGVLAHELGHVQHRHGMRTLVQFTALSTVTSIALGDFSGVLAGAPALLGQMSYSRTFEREADAESVRLLLASGLSPEVMVVFFENVARWRKNKPAEAGFDPGIALSSHPADEERIAFFRNAARAP
jgi:Zn-dependent protease with chaperone function